MVEKKTKWVYVCLLEIICLEASSRRRLAQGRNKNWVAAEAGFRYLNKQNLC
jgi:hypothetical protein